MAYVVTQLCVDVKHKDCLDECPVDAIYEGERTVYINPDECVDCGTCEAVCPAGAIFYEDDLPEEFENYADIAREFFAMTGASGGGAFAGPQHTDELRVAQLPPQL
ncbi:MAG: ferredoxin family protein [Propionibacteriaceae bacterium]|jgi:ferredoxin|nr:ferredoxin family protein [Propionibacteriaceae bacterium]